MTLHDKTFRALASGAVGLVLINTWVASHALHTLFTAQSWQAHTLDVVAQTEALALEMRTADANARGYLLTADPMYLDRFNAAQAAAQGRLDAVARLTADNASQRARVAYTRNRMAHKFAALETGMAMRRGHTENEVNPALLEPVLSDSPDGQASVGYCITQIEGEEQRLLAQRSSETKTARLWAQISFYGASVLDIVLLLTAYRLLAESLAARRRQAADSDRIAHLNEELSVLNADLEARVQSRTRELEVSNKELEAFSYSVSHDLRAPLRTIDGFSLALQEDYGDRLDDDGRDYIARVRGGVQRMGSLIDALLQLSRVTRSEVQREQVDLSALSTLIFNELQAASPERRVSFTAQPGVTAFADPRLLRITFENLLGNAFKYTAKTEAAEIHFGQATQDGHAVYFIRDNGVGFDMQYVDRLFTAFQRLHGDRDFKGSGIGLATVSRIIRRHHGDIWATGEVDHGATFSFTLDS